MANPKGLCLFFKSFVLMFVLGISVLIFVDIQLVKAFSAKRWAVPAKVYARPLELYPKMNLSMDALVAELKRLNYRQTSDLRARGTYQTTATTLEIHSRGFRFWDGQEPARRLVLAFKAVDAGQQLDQIRAKDQLSPPGILRLEPMLIGGIYASESEDRELIRLNQAPALLLQSLIAVEDRQFFEHKGLSFRGIARALVVNLFSGEVKQGGSTLTQQLVKNLFLTDERAYSRKLIEAFMALLLEFHYSKEEILEVYLNEVYLGQAGNHGIHGFGLASLHYFGMPIEDLDVHQIALLVGMVKGASWYNPRRHPERALNRRHQVLALMHAQGLITHAQFQRSTSSPLDIIKSSSRRSRYPAFLDLVKRQLKQDYAVEDLKSNGLKLFTTLDPQIQAVVEASVDKRLPQLTKQYLPKGATSEALEAAVVVAQPQTGEVLAMVGGRRHQYAGFNRALDAKRPIGSIIKPAVYLTALSQGYHWGTLLQDEPVTLDTDQGPWTPQNFNEKSHGPVLMIDALASSYNQATVRLGLSVGVDHVADLVEQSSGVQQNTRVPAYVLGTTQMSPYEVTALYQTFANNGFKTPLQSIRAVADVYGDPISRYPLKVQQIYDESSMYLLTYGMQRVFNEGTARSAYWRIPKHLALAGKTGTSDSQRDAWFSGFSGNLLATVWIGRDDNGRTALTGANSALVLWTDMMQQLPLTPVVRARPADVRWIWVDPDTGGRSDPDCPGVVRIPVYKDVAPDHTSGCGGRSWSGPGWLRRLFGR